MSWIPDSLVGDWDRRRPWTGVPECHPGNAWATPCNSPSATPELAASGTVPPERCGRVLGSKMTRIAPDQWVNASDGCSHGKCIRQIKSDESAVVA